MDESSFDIDQLQVAEAARRFPAQRHTAAVARPSADVSYLNAGPEFGRHAWDECGHL